MMSEWNMTITALLVGLPLALVSGPHFIAAFWILFTVAMLVLHPIPTAVVLGLWLLRKPVKWFFEGLFIGEGVRASGVVSRLSRPLRSRRWTKLPPRGPRRAGPVYAMERRRR
jgi:hypothetical protein